MTILANANNEYFILGTAKEVDEYIIVETKDYTRLFLCNEFEKWIQERNFKIA